MDCIYYIVHAMVYENMEVAKYRIENNIVDRQYMEVMLHNLKSI